MIVRSLLTAGVDTTVTGIAAIVHALATTPGATARLKRDRHLTRTAFEEAVRLTSPVQTFFRTATRDLQVGGVDIRDGEKILMFLGSANRDPRRWDGYLSMLRNLKGLHTACAGRRSLPRWLRLSWS